MSTTITLKFTPVEDYFFGKENKDKNGDENYFLKSHYLPQATTLLGAVRFWMLLATNNFENGAIIDKSKANKDIGAESFKLNNTFSFGKIEAISNVFLLNKDNQKYIAAPLWLDATHKEFTWNEDMQSAVLPSYDPKNYYPPLFTNGVETIAFDTIFNETVYSHNRKNNKENKNEDAYYKTQTYWLKDGFAFGVQITLSEDLKSEPLFMKIGGENKLFKVEIIDTVLKSESEILNNYSNNKNYKLILTSDAYFESLNKSDYLFALIETKNFRSLYANINAIGNYNALDKTKSDNKQIVKSSLFQLIQAGAVFYFKDEDNANAFIKKHLNNENLSKAGFNHFQLIHPKNK